MELWNYQTETGECQPASFPSFIVLSCIVLTSPFLFSQSLEAVEVAASHSIDVKAYPNPWRADRHANTPVTFDNLPSGGQVKIFTVSGHQVKTLPPGAGTWDLTNEGGDKVASGVYIFLVTDGRGGKATGKVAIIR